MQLCVVGELPVEDVLPVQNLLLLHGLVVAPNA